MTRSASLTDRFVTVVIPLFNKEKYIERAINSVLAQKYQDFQVIVVDDGSIDRSVDILRKALAGRDNRVTVIEQDNSGECGARNRGVRESDTEWVAFLDADDEWDEDFLAECVKAVTSFPQASAVFTNVMDAFTSKTLIPASKTGGVVEDYFDFYVGAYGRGMTSSSCMIRRSVLCDVGMFPLGVRYGGDTDTWARVAWTGVTIYVAKSLSVYHTEATGSVMKDPKTSVAVREISELTAREKLTDGEVSPRLVRSTIKYIKLLKVRYASNLVSARKNSEALKVLLEVGTPPFPTWRYYLSVLFRAVLPYRMVTLIRMARGS